MSDENKNLGFEFLEVEGLEIDDQIIEIDENAIPQIDLDEEEEEEEVLEKKEVEEKVVEEEQEEEEEVEEEEEETELENLSVKITDFVDVLKENELFSIEEGVEVTEEVIIEGIKKASELKAAKNIYEIVTKVKGEKGWSLFEDLFIKGAGNDYLENAFEIEELESLDLEDASVQEKVYAQYLKETTQMTDEEIGDQITFFKEKNKLDAKAEFARTELIKSKENIKKTAADRAAEIEKEKSEKETAYKETLKASLKEAMEKKEIEGVPLTSDDQNSLIPYMTAKKFELANGIKISEFERDMLDLRRSPNTALKLAKLVKEKLNTSIVADKKESKKAKFLFKELENQVRKPAPESKGPDLSKLLNILD